MKEYAFIFRLNNPSDARPRPEQMQERMQWLADLVAKDIVAYKGNTLSAAGAKTVWPGHAVKEGLQPESPGFVSGYLVIRATDMDEAVRLAGTNPILKAGGYVEVREVVKRPE